MPALFVQRKLLDKHNKKNCNCEKIRFNVPHILLPLNFSKVTIHLLKKWGVCA